MGEGGEEGEEGKREPHESGCEPTELKLSHH